MNSKNRVLSHAFLPDLSVDDNAYVNFPFKRIPAIYSLFRKLGNFKLNWCRAVEEVLPSILYIIFKAKIEIQAPLF